ncbi:uncharacterized protein LOC141666227 [Apium graveolens]|uniref:uncharacterized protein LOC141666227 n=1 Tax=Apium graveolens TaxID=4045 RepID=UPI003D7B44EE
MGGEEGDKFFNLEDLNADYGRKYRRTKQLNRNKENVGSMANIHTPSTKTNRSPLFTPTIVSSGSQKKTPTSMLTESTSNIVRLVGKRRKLGDLPRSGHLNETAASSQDRTPLSDVTNSGSASFSRNMLREETRSNINDISLNEREPLNRKGKENYLGFGRELFADEIVSDDEEESNDFNEGPNVVAPLFLSDDSEGSDYEASDCESSDDADCLSWSLDGDDEVIVDGMNSDCNLMQSRHVPRRVVPEEYASLGGPTAICSKCHARMLKEERVNKNVTKGCPIFSLCCMKGAVRLPPIPPTPEYLLDLYNDKKRGPTFHRLIRLYNAIFSFTSTGGNIDHSINNGRAPYVYKLNGQNHHVFGSLIPNDNETPKFCQLYIYDTINEVDNRLRQHLELYESDEIVELQITLKVIRSESGRECHISSTDEVVGIMVGDTEETCGDRDIVVKEKGKGLVRVSYVHPKLMALQYPLLFPRGEDGFHPKIKFQKTADSSCKPRGFLSLENYYSYTFQIRESDGKKMMEYVPGCIAPNCPDIISRVFRLELDQLMVDIKDKKNFGVCIRVMYVVEFQKRGLPHNVDNFVSAEIPDHLLDPVGYAAVKEFMIHGPCGLQNVKSPCMKDLRCIRHFTKKYCARTTFDDSGFPMYMRRRTNITVEIRKAQLDNQWVVPYNRDLLVKYQCHMNVEICCHARSLKYLFNNCLKGHDRVTVHVQRKRKRQANDTDEGGIDEINAYFDGRYLCGAESAYRIFGFPIYHRSISVERLQFHLPCDKNCTFHANEALGKVDVRKKNKFSKLEAFFYLNSVDVNAREYTYDEILRFYVWNDGERKWTMRKHGFQIGRLCYVHHSTGEPWFSSFIAYEEYGLLDDDKEWHEVLTQASAGGLPPQFYALGEIDELIRSVGKSLKKFDQLPQPPRSYLNNGTNNLIIEETSYDTRKTEYETAKLLHDCTEEQRKIYDAVIQSIDTNVGGIFFVYGSGGCGKTFLWRTLICKLRSQGKIVLPVASSAIAATLMFGGRTAHSRFKIPIVLDECSTCNIAHDSDVVQLIKQTQLIIWDEAPMQHRYAFECLDRSLKDIIKAVDPERYTMPFGGITVVLGGDFRQILPVITYADRADIVAACITRSWLWSICQVFLLTENMRLKQGESDSESEKLKKFTKWVLDIGNGPVSPPRVCNLPVTENQILIPSQFCDVQTENTVDNMICSTYPNFAHKGHSTQYLSERAILTPTNQTVGHLNSLIVDKLPGESVSYFSVDAAEEFGGTDENLNEAFPIEYLNSLNVAGMPPHDLKLKVGVVVMLMRNLNQTLGLCNGTRMIVTKCLRFCVECEVICGTFVGSNHFIPRMELSPSDTKMSFKLVRKQMPLQICYAMTINKSQSQFLKTVRLYLPKSVFTHGQYYVAISRVTSPTGLTIFVDDESGAATNITQNVVYKEVFYGLPEA